MGAALRSRTRVTRGEGPGLTSPLCSGPSGSSGVRLLPRSSPGVRRGQRGAAGADLHNGVVGTIARGLVPIHQQLAGNGSFVEL